MNTFREIAHLHARFRSFSESGITLSHEARRMLDELRIADTDRADALAGEIASEFRHLMSLDMSPLDEECSRSY